MISNPETSFYTIKQVAQILQVDRKTVSNLIKRGRLPGARRIDPYSPRSTWRIPIESLEQFQNQQV
jgi:excisionase family DNA binding protein